MNFEKLKRLIAEGEEELAIDMIVANINSIENKKLRNEAIHTSSRLKKLLTDKRLGLLENENSNVSQNQITKAIIELVEKIDKSYTLNRISKYKRKVKPLLPIVIAIIVVFLFFRRDYFISLFNTTQINSGNTELIENIEIEGGNIIYDIILTNIGKSNLILNRLNINSSSNGWFQCLSGEPGGLEVIAEYEIDFHVNSHENAILMEPPLIIPNKESVRFKVKGMPDKTGSCGDDIDFTCSLQIYSGEKIVAQTKPKRFNYEQIILNKRSTIERIEKSYLEDKSNPAKILKYVKAIRQSYGDENLLIEILQKGVLANQNDSELYMQLAYIHSDMYEDSSNILAVQNFEKAIGLSSENISRMDYGIKNAYVEIGEFYISKMNLDEASRILKRGIELSNTYEDFYFYLAAVYALKQDCKNSVSNLMKFIEYETSSTWNPKERIKSYSDKNKFFYDISGCAEFKKLIN